MRAAAPQSQEKMLALILRADVMDEVLTPTQIGEISAKYAERAKHILDLHRSKRDRHQTHFNLWKKLPVLAQLLTLPFGTFSARKWKFHEELLKQADFSYERGLSVYRSAYACHLLGQNRFWQSVPSHAEIDRDLARESHGGHGVNPRAAEKSRQRVGDRNQAHALRAVKMVIDGLDDLFSSANSLEIAAIVIEEGECRVDYLLQCETMAEHDAQVLAIEKVGSEVSRMISGMVSVNIPVDQQPWIKGAWVRVKDKDGKDGTYDCRMPDDVWQQVIAEMESGDTTEALAEASADTADDHGEVRDDDAPSRRARPSP